MRQFKLWRCWPEDPTKPWDWLNSTHAESYEQAWAFFEQAVMMYYIGDGDYIITF